MHVVIVSDFETQGGAAIGTTRLAEGLIRAGVRVTRLVSYPDGRTHPWATQLLRGRSGERFLGRVLQRISKRVSIDLALSMQKMWVHRSLHRALAALRPDMINVNNLHGAGWWPDLLEVCTRHAPTVWTLRDMWSFTGRCAYSYDCRKFINGCDSACPTPDEYPALHPKLIAGSWALRRRLLAAHPDLVAVCPSRWLAKEALCGLWSGHRVEIIPNGLSLETYKGVERDVARAALGINTPGPVLLVSAQNVQEPRKGGGILSEALQGVVHRPITLVTMGHGSLPETPEGIHLHPLGYIDDERTKVLAYNAADMLVQPALMDNLPHVVMEAIACGTPVLGFPIGGVPDMVRPSQTGWLAKEVTPEALATAIDTAIEDLESGIDLRDTCRAVAEAEYGTQVQAERYLDLFRSMGVLDSSH